MFGWGKKEEEAPPKEELIISIEPVEELEPTPPVVEQTKNPGKFEDLNKESKEITGDQDSFDGLKCDLGKVFHDTFQVSHSVGLGSAQEAANYSFSASWVGGIDPRNIKPPKTLLHGRINTDGQLIGRYFQYLMPKLQLKVIGQTSNEPHNNGVHTELEYSGDDWHGQMKWINPGTYGISYHQAITQRFSMGCDLFYRYQQSFSMATYGMRYNTGKSISTAVVNSSSAAFSYSQILSKQVRLSTELVFGASPNGIESKYTLGMDYSLRMSTFRAHIDSGGRVVTYLEEMLNPNTKVLLSAELDHKKKQYKFGMGLSLMI